MPLVTRTAKGSPLTTAEMDGNLTLLEGQYKGTATPSTNPTAEKGFYYLATTPGTYTNFGGLTVGHEIAYLRYTGTAWVKDVVSSLLRPGAVVGKVTSGWIHVKTLTRDSGTGTITCVIEVGTNTTIEMQGVVGAAAYGASTLTLNAGEYTRTVTTTSAPTTGTAAIAIDLTTNQPVYLAGTVSTTSRLCLLSTQADSYLVSAQRSILPSNHFFAVGGTNQQNPDTTQTVFHVTHYGASTFTGAVDNSAALFYCKWAAQVVNQARKNLERQFADTSPPEIDIVFPIGTFLADFTTTKYALTDVYAYGYWPYFEGIRLVGSGIDKTTLKHTGGSTTSGILAAEGLTLHRIFPGVSPWEAEARFEEVRFKRVRWYFDSADTASTATMATRVTQYSRVDRVYFQKCELDYRGDIYVGIGITNYDLAVVEDCVLNPSKLGFAYHPIRVEEPKSKFSRYRCRRNRVYKGTTGAFSRLLDTYKPMVGTLIEDNEFEGIVEESVAIDGIGDSTSAPVIGNGLITSVEQPPVCPGEHQWLRWRTITPNNEGTWSTPVCLTNNTTSTAYAFKASSNQPSTPTGTALVPSGWSGTIPISNDPIWMSKATITGGSAGTWSVPVDITEVRCFQVGTTVFAPTGYIDVNDNWSRKAPALPFTNVWMCKTHSVNGMVRGLNNTWSTPVKIDSTPGEATWTEYCTGTTFSSTVPPDKDGAVYKVWRNSPWAHNLVIGADLRRLSNNPVAIARSMEDFFFVFEDDSGREGTVCDILYADPVTQKLTLNLDAPVDSINIGGWCAVHSGLFDSVIRGNRINSGTTAISLFMNIFGCLVEDNKTLNCNQGLNLVGMLAQTYLRCRAHNNIVRGNAFQGMREESYGSVDSTRALVAIGNEYANDPDHRNFNNSVTDNTFVGGRIDLRYQSNLTWDDNRLIDVTDIRRTHCRMALPTASSAAAGQVVTRIQDDRDVMSVHALPVASMTPGQTYIYYKLGNTNWTSIFTELTGNQLPGPNQGYVYNGNTPTGNGQVMPFNIPATSMAAGGTYMILSPGNTNWTNIGTAQNTWGTVFVYNGVVVTGNGAVQPYFRGSPASITYHVCKLVNGVYTWVEV